MKILKGGYKSECCVREGKQQNIITEEKWCLKVSKMIAEEMYFYCRNESKMLFIVHCKMLSTEDGKLLFTKKLKI